MDSPNCMQTILDDLKLVDTRGPFHQDCSPTAGPPEAIWGWSGPAVGGEVMNDSRAKRAAKFWT